MYVFNVYVWGPHGGWAMLSGLVHTCMYVFNFYWFCTFLYIHVLSLNKDFIIIIIIEVKQTSHVSIINFKNEIANSDIYSKMNKDIDSDPNINYDIIHNILKSATKQHLAPKIVKFDKRRHKKSQ